MTTPATFAAAVLDERYPLVWLARVACRGSVLYFAEEPIETTGGRKWRPALVVEQAPQQDADPYEGRYSATRATIRILPMPHDPHDTTARREFHGLDLFALDSGALRVNLYLHPKGCAFPDASHLALRGESVGLSMADDGSLVVQLADVFSARNAALHSGVISPESFSDAPADSMGLAYPIVMGTPPQVETPIIDAAGKKVLVGSGTMGDVTDLAVNDETGKLSSHTTEADGNDVTCSVAVASVTLDDTTRVWCAATGETDDAEGTYSGTAGGALNHPADQLYALALRYAGFDEDYLHRGSFVGLRSATAGWLFDTVVGTRDKGKTWWDVAGELCKWMRAIPHTEGRMLRLDQIDFDAAPTVTFSGADIVAIESLEWQDRERIVNQIAMRYAWGFDAARKVWDYKATLTRDAHNYPPFAVSQRRYGKHPLRDGLDNPYVSDAATATECLSLYAELNERPRMTARIRFGRRGLLARVSNVVRVGTALAPTQDGSGWDAKDFVVIGRSPLAMGAVLTLLEC